MTKPQRSKKTTPRARVPVAERCERIGARVTELRAIERQARTAERMVNRAVRFARAGGASWEAIASQLGTSRQAAWERYAEGADR